jgi:retron-type reverse transcriptase
MQYLTSAGLLPSLQSGFRPGHSTETAVLRVLSDILQAVDRGDVASLILLDLSVAFDTVDHDIMLQRLQVSFGIVGAAHQWFQSYLLGRFQCVRRGPFKSSSTRLTCGVPQGSVL